MADLKAFTHDVYQSKSANVADLQKVGSSQCLSSNPYLNTGLSRKIKGYSNTLFKNSRTTLLTQSSHWPKLTTPRKKRGTGFEPRKHQGHKATITLVVFLCPP